MSVLMRLILGIISTFVLMLLISLLMSWLEAKKERKEKEVSRAFERIKQEEGLEYVNLRDLTEEEIQHFKELWKKVKPELVRLEPEEPEEVKCHHIYNQYSRFYDAKRMCNTIHLKCGFCGEVITINVTDGVIFDLFNDLDAFGGEG